LGENLPMPEGPSIVILREAVQQFTGKTVISVSGNSKIEKSRLVNKKINSFKSWGKHFLICFTDFTVRVHLLMFGSYSINARKEQPVRLNLTFKNGELNLYSCAIKILEGDINNHYDWSVDVMNERWNPGNAKAKLIKAKNQLICDALLDQNIFSGVGNIIKNEILYRVRIHPESIVGKIPAVKIKRVVEEARTYSFEFLAWKKKYELRKHLLIHGKGTCLRCNLPVIRKYTGIKDRISFFCLNCQIQYR
jgi:endonuclease-8